MEETDQTVPEVFRMIKKLSFLLLFSAALLFSSSCASHPASPSSSFFLPSSVTVYHRSLTTGEWEEEYRQIYTYENAFPLTQTMEEKETAPHTFSFEYSLENGIPVSMNKYDQDGTLLLTAQYNEGRVYEVRSETADSKTRQLYQYGCGGEYFTAFLNDTRLKNGSSMEEIDSVNVTLENGLLRKTIHSGLYANTGAGEEKEWMRFNGTYTLDYTEGLVSRTSVVYRAGPPGETGTFEYTKENGLVTAVIVRSQLPDQDTPEDHLKIVFAYTDIGTDQSRYTRMINAHILGDSSTFYNFNWY